MDTTKAGTVVRNEYKDPDYIKKIKERRKQLECGHRLNKILYRLRTKEAWKKNAVKYVNQYLDSIKELNYIYTILRQHNEMKKMYGKLNERTYAKVKR